MNTKENSINNNDLIKEYKITNINTFNKYLLSISTAAFTLIAYALSHNELSYVGLQWLLKVALCGFTFSILATMFALILMIDDPQPKKCKGCLIDLLDWTAFIIFSISTILSALAVILL